MIEITLKYTLFRAGELIASGTLVAPNLFLSFRLLDSLIEKYHADHLCVRDSHGKFWEKDCG